MRGIFADFEKNSRKAGSELLPAPYVRVGRLPLRKRLIVIFILILCAVLMTGFISAFFSGNFYGAVFTDNTQLFITKTENDPTTIEYEYYLPELPEGFEEIQHDSLSFCVVTLYKNRSTGKNISFSQCTKENFDGHFNTEQRDFEEIEINGHDALLLDLSDDDGEGAIVVWDNGDYVLEIFGELDKNIIIKLAESIEVLKN
ncbi:MAG: DUF4367 domain-containing protein [Firmicutes bacterium]|nr:DUF4367 domain-containing protein [[Eubacterium] siraeum]MCM1487058.1 DUF4367 domain-containing protein [Bacillota bacterium]